MSNILSYNNKTTGEGWIALENQYSADEIEMINDPNGGLSSKPRTAIPSPFAQMDLVKNAFNRLSEDHLLQGEKMDEKLVSNALDTAQLFFNYTELKNELKIVEWNRKSELQKLKNSPEHQLFGETIEMFLQQDKEAFNFDMMDKIFFLVYGNKVIGSTSPVTLFMGSPNAGPNQFNIPVEQNINLFEEWRPLYKRNEKFVKYIYALFTAYPQLKKQCSEVNKYIIVNFELLDAGLHHEILKEIGNPSVFDENGKEKAFAYLSSNFQQSDEGVQVLGVPFFELRQEDITRQISESDFIIVPSKQVNENLPLILQNHLGATQTDAFKYISGAWDDSITIKEEDYSESPDKRVLPSTTHVYPWLTDDDFFQPAMIKLDFTMNRDCFFNGNLSLGSKEADDCDFVLPLKPLFFKYFGVKDLLGTINGRPRFELIHNKVGQAETVKAVLRIPVKKQGAFITLQREYVPAFNGDFSYDHKNNKGHFVTVPFALSIFPFIRAQGLKQYNVQLIDRALGLLENYRLDLSFYQNGYKAKIKDEDVIQRDRSLKSEKRVGSRYYRLKNDFDYINVTLTNDVGNAVVDGLICPLWNEYVPGHAGFTFAVDFGTTNTHVESMQNDQMPEPLKITSSARERMLATLYNGESIFYDVIMKQEFLPRTIGEEYGFPQRTVLSECERLDAKNVDRIIALGDANIPFIYEKESIGYGNHVIPNLKWSTEAEHNKRIKAYLTELALLMRTKVLLENGDISKTRLVWFYPLAMKVGNIRKLGDMWSKTFQEVFGIPSSESNLTNMPESVAPYYFYKCSSKFRGSASTVASIDIGGGSSDVVIFESNAKQPTVLTSFRFAANVLFGDGFSEVPLGDTNPMVVKYVDYFKRLFDADDDKYGELNGILDDITLKRKSEDINAFLFSIINNKVVGGNDVFSYNMRLNEDEPRKIIFLYFYATLIYYVANMMKHKNLDMPRSVMFSGTGSKVLDIVGSQRELDLLTKAIFERVYGQIYDNDGFSIIMEKKEPKQITCRGALMQLKNKAGSEEIHRLNNMLDDFECNLKGNYSMISKSNLTYDDMENPDIRAEIIGQVKKFNDFFIALCESIHVEERFLVDHQSFQLFKQYVSKDLEHHLINGWNFVNQNQEDKNGSDHIEDTLFFYPVIGSIHDNLIETLK